MIDCYIIHWNNPADCIKTVREFYMQGVDINVNVIDNASDELNLQILKNGLNDNVKLICLSKNIGFGPGLNVGLIQWIEKFVSEYAIVSAHDSIPHENCFSSLIKVMDDNPDIGIACPEYGDPARIAKFDSFKGFYISPCKRIGEMTFQDYPFGTLMIFRRDCIREIGIFDEQYFAYGEEVDIGLRAWSMGWKVAVVWNALLDNPTRTVSSEFSAYLQVRNSILLVRKWRGAMHASVRSILFLLNAVRLSMLSRAERPNPYSFKSWIKGIRDAWI